MTSSIHSHLSRFLLLPFLLSVGLGKLPAQEIVQFSPASDWICNEGAFELRGTYSGQIGPYVYLFLKDRFGNFYLQYPRVEFIEEGKWEHFNVRVYDNITTVWAVEVDKKGAKTIEKWKRKNQWKDLGQGEIEALSGFQQVGRGRISDLHPCRVPAECKEVVNLTDDVVIIADFEKDREDKGFPLGGKIDTWVSQKEQYEMIVENVLLEGGKEETLGKYVLGTVYAPHDPGTKPAWKGGGLIIFLGKDGQCFDLSPYTYLEFEIRLAKKNQLQDLRIKLTDSQEGFEVERALKAYEVDFNKSEWSTVHIPLQDFSSIRFNDSVKWKKTDLRQVINLSFLGVIDIDRPTCKGTIQIDNIRLIK